MKLFLNLAPIIISVIALWVSIKSLRNQTPHLRVCIKNKKYDCFYGASKVREINGSYFLSQYIAVLRLSFKNPTAANITISNISLMHGGITYDLADTDNPHWKEIEMFYPDVKNINEDGHGYSTDGSYIDYESKGAKVPITIEPYGVKEYYAVFYNFPKSSKNTIKAKLIIETANGMQKKKVPLSHYDENYETGECEEIEKFNKSY